MQALTSGDGNLVHGAMRVLTGMINKFNSEKPPIVQYLRP